MVTWQGSKHWNVKPSCLLWQALESLSSYIPTSQGSWRGQMQWGECQRSPGIPLQGDTKFGHALERLGCLAKGVAAALVCEATWRETATFPSSNQLHTVPSNTHVPVSSSLSSSLHRTAWHSNLAVSSADKDQHVLFHSLSRLSFSPLNT